DSLALWRLLRGAVSIGNQAYAQCQKRIGSTAGQTVGEQVAHATQPGNAAHGRRCSRLHDGRGQLCKIDVVQTAGNQHASADVAVQIAHLLKGWAQTVDASNAPYQLNLADQDDQAIELSVLQQSGAGQHTGCRAAGFDFRRITQAGKGVHDFF